MDIETYNGFVHGAEVAPRRGIRGEAMNHMVPTVVVGTNHGEAAFACPTAPVARRAAVAAAQHPGRRA